MYIKDFEIIIYPVECRFLAVANKNGESGMFSLGEYSSEEKAQKIAPIRLQNLIDAQDSEFIMWVNRKEDYFTILKQRDEAVEMLKSIVFTVFWNGGNLNLEDKERIESFTKSIIESK